MNTDKKAKFNSPSVVAAVILAAGLIISAGIYASKNTQLTSGQAAAASAQSAALAVPSEASIREQFVSQMNAQYEGSTKMLFGEKQAYNGISVNKIQIATAGDKIDIDYELHWWDQSAGAVTGTGCILTRNDYGHFTNVNDIVADKGEIKPQLDIQ